MSSMDREQYSSVSDVSSNSNLSTSSCTQGDQNTKLTESDYETQYFGFSPESFCDGSKYIDQNLSQHKQKNFKTTFVNTFELPISFYYVNFGNKRYSPSKKSFFNVVTVQFQFTML